MSLFFLGLGHFIVAFLIIVEKSDMTQVFASCISLGEMLICLLKIKSNWRLSVVCLTNAS